MISASGDHCRRDLAAICSGKHLSNVVIISRAWLQTNFPGVYEYDHILELQAQGAGIIMVTDGARPVLVVRGGRFSLRRGAL